MSDALQIHDKARGLFRVARILEWVAIIGGVLGVIAGLAVAGTSDKAADGTSTTTPYGGLGFSIVLAAVLNAALFWAIARALVLFAMDVNSRHSNVPLDTSLALGSSTRPSVWPPADQSSSESSTGSEPTPGSARVWSRGAPKPPPPSPPSPPAEQ